MRVRRGRNYGLDAFHIAGGHVSCVSEWLCVERMNAPFRQTDGFVDKEGAGAEGGEERHQGIFYISYLVRERAQQSLLYHYHSTLAGNMPKGGLGN